MAQTQYQLTVRKGPKVGESFLLETISLTIGRDPVSDVVLNDPEVSRQHARFSQTETGYQVQDLGSTNGTFVNGQRLEAEPVDLEPGFTISMGSGVTLVYDIVSTGDAMAATMVDHSGLGELMQNANMVDSDEDLGTAVDYEPDIPADWEPDPSPPFTPPPPPVAPPLVPTSHDNEAAKNKRRNTIIAVSVIFILLCCCGFLIFMWQYGGDWLLKTMGII